MKLLIIPCFILSSLSFAYCKKQQVEGGAAWNNIVYEIEGENDRKVGELSSISSFSLRPAWRGKCFNYKGQIRAFSDFKFLNLGNIQTDSLYQDLSEKYFLPKIGLEYRLKIKKNLQWITRFFWRKELGLEYNIEKTQLLKNNYDNLAPSTGLRFYIKARGQREMSARANITYLHPVSGHEDKSGALQYDLALEGKQKLSKKTSIHFEAFHEYFKQNYGKLSIRKSEQGIRTDLIFSL